MYRKAGACAENAQAQDAGGTNPGQSQVPDSEVLDVGRCLDPVLLVLLLTS